MWAFVTLFAKGKKNFEDLPKDGVGVNCKLFSVIEVYCVTVMLRSLEINLQPSTLQVIYGIGILQTPILNRLSCGVTSSQ